MAWVENIVPRDILNASTSSSSFFSYLQLNLNDSFDRFFRLAVSLINFFFFFLNNYACSWWFFFFNFYSFFFFSLNSLANKKVFPFFLSMNTNLKIKYDKNGWSWLLESFFLFIRYVRMLIISSCLWSQTWVGRVASVGRHWTCQFSTTQKITNTELLFILGKLSNTLFWMHFFRLIFLTL